VENRNTVIAERANKVFFINSKFGKILIFVWLSVKHYSYQKKAH